MSLTVDSCQHGLPGSPRSLDTHVDYIGPAWRRDSRLVSRKDTTARGCDITMNDGNTVKGRDRWKISPITEQDIPAAAMISREAFIDSDSKCRRARYVPSDI